MALHFWIETMTEEEVVEKIKKVIDDKLYLTESEYGYSFDAYVDYTDELSAKDLKKIFESKNPKEVFNELIFEYYREYEFEEQAKIASEIQKEFPEQYHEYIEEWVEENVYLDYPLDEYLKKEICVDVSVDTGDANYDFTLNDYSDGKIDDLASAVWLAKQQGYSKKELNEAYNNGDYTPDGFLDSLIGEFSNECSHMNTLTFLVKMTLKDAIEIYGAKQSLENSMTHDEKYEPKKNKNQSYIVLGKETETGFLDFWNGSGSQLEIKLEKDVKLPLKYIYEILPDDCYDYGFRRIFGCGREYYRDTLKEVKFVGAADIKNM